MKPISLTEKNIKGYGYLLHESNKKPKHDSDEFKFTGDVYKFSIDGEITVGILIGRKRKIKLECVEKHTETEEILIQLENDSIIFLAKPSMQINEADIKAFYFKQGEAVVLNKGTWHWIPYPINNKECKTLIGFKDGTGENDCEIQNLRSHISLD